MAKIIEVNIPEEYKNKNKYEIYSHLEQVSQYAHNLKQEIQDKDAEIKLRDSQLQKQRADIMKLKSVIEHHKIEIHNLKLDSVVEEIEHEVVEDKGFNYMPASVKFDEVEGNIPQDPIEKKR